MKVPKYRKEGTKIFAEFEENTDIGNAIDRKMELSAQNVLEIFRRISDDDCRTLGLNPGMQKRERENCETDITNQCKK